MSSSVDRNAPKRVGLTQRVLARSATGERWDCLDQRWAVLLRSLGFIPIPLPNCSGVEAEQLIDECQLSAVVLTGGNDVIEAPLAVDSAPERDSFERCVLAVCAARRIPALGVCRGLQLIVAVHGGTLDRIEGHVAVRHRIFPDAQQGSIPHDLTVNSYHRYGCSELPTCLDVLARAEDGSIEAARHIELPIYGIMWHPEREQQLSEFHGKFLTKALGGLL